MKTFIFLCIVSVLALTFTSPVSGEEEHEVNKRFLDKVFKKIKHTFNNVVDKVKKEVEHLKDGAVQLANGVTQGSKKIGQLITKEGKQFGTLFLNSAAGQAIIQIGGKAYQLNKDLYDAAKSKFEKQVKDVNFETVLYEVFPVLKADAKDCKEAVKVILRKHGGIALAKAGEPVSEQVCNVRDHVVKVLKEKVTA